MVSERVTLGISPSRGRKISRKHGKGEVNEKKMQRERENEEMLKQFIEYLIIFYNFVQIFMFYSIYVNLLFNIFE